MSGDAPASRQQPADDIDHPLVSACYNALKPLEWVFSPHRQYLGRDLQGVERVLDLGAGNGAQFPHVAELGAPAEYHAIEPDPHMRSRAVTTARETGLPVDIRDARAESLPYPDDCFDVVIAGLVFCTIADPDAALTEVARVLKPGGELRFLEHVRADGWRSRGQALCNPLWKRAAGGCNLTRATIERFVGHDAFDVCALERLTIGIFPATPLYRGTLLRRR